MIAIYFFVVKIYIVNTTMDKVLVKLQKCLLLFKKSANVFTKDTNL